MFDASQYTIGWVCAIQPELVAARLHLDQEHDSTEYEAATNDDNTYVFGNIGKHNVVIATLPLGEYGTSSAASVARDLIRSFRNVRVGFMVGIGGGAPLVGIDDKKKQDIRLGDVVVSIPGQGRGGVCQYDYGKAIQGQDFLLTGHLNSPPKSVLAAVTVLSTDFDLNGHGIDEGIAAVLTDRPPKLRQRYRRPDSDTDRLYQSSFVHPDAEERCSVCCKEELLVDRAARGEDEENVSIHYGLIASANTLMKDAALRNALAKDLGVLCFEMEAAGLMNQLPFLVIRGICDYSDSHKSKEWQGYAAMTAAAYAKRLLLQLPSNKVEAEPAISEIKELLEQATGEISQMHKKINSQHEHNTERNMQQWLAAPDPSTNYNKAIELRYPGSGSWLFEDDIFRQSLENQPLIWLHGMSGCGKTVLATTIIERLQQSDDNNHVTLYFYFDFQDAQKQTFDAMLRALIKQMYQAAHGQRLLQSLHETCDEGGKQPSKEQLVKCLDGMLQTHDHVTMILDALDECTTRSDIFAWLRRLRTDQIRQARMIITSRQEHDVKEAFEAHLPEQAIIAIESGPVQKDIEAYIKHQLEHDSKRFGRWHRRPDVLKMIEERLVAKADGMFRWAACQLDVLGDCINLRTLRIALDGLPATLNETYKRILQNIPKNLRPETTRILQFLTYSSRLLSCDELVDALAVSLEGEATFDTGMRIQKLEDLTIATSSLVSYTTVSVPNPGQPRASIGRVKKKALQLAHLSVKEFLLSAETVCDFGQDLTEPVARSTMAKTCLTYLLSIEHDLSLTHTCIAFALTLYSAENWASHAASLSNPDAALRQLMLRLLDERVEGYKICQRIGRKFYRAVRPLFYAANAGIRAAVQDMLDQKVDVDEFSDQNRTAVYAASKYGHTEIVGMLIGAGASVNADRRNALRAASKYGHTEIVSMLIDAGASVNADGGSALRAASEIGHADVVRMLIEAGADVNIGHRSALYAASQAGHTEIVRMLIDAGADANTYDGRSLPTAAKNGHTEIVRMLIDAGANVNHPNTRLGTALQAALEKGHAEIAKLLLATGADVHAVGGNKPDALVIASHRGNAEFVHLLLNIGTAINKKNYLSALRTAWHQGHDEVVKELIDARNVAIVSEIGSFSHAAKPSLDVDLLKSLLDPSDYVDLRPKHVYRHTDTRRANAYISSLLGGKESIASWLIRRGNELDATSFDSLGRTFIHLSAVADYGEGIKSAFDRSLDLNMTDNVQWTALHWAVYFGSAEAVKVLLKLGADSALTDRHGRTPMQLASFAEARSVTEHEAAKEVANLLTAQGDVESLQYKEMRIERCDSCAHRLLYGDCHYCTECSYWLCFRCILDVYTLHPDHVFRKNRRLLLRPGARLPDSEEDEIRSPG